MFLYYERGREKKIIFEKIWEDRPIFKVGEILEVSGVRLRIEKIVKKKLILKMLPRKVSSIIRIGKQREENVRKFMSIINQTND